MLKVGRALRPDRVVFLGDVIDAYCLSAHGGRALDRSQFLKDEIDAANLRLDEVQKLGAKRVDFLEGNHSVRASRYISDKAPELFGLVTIPKLLRIAERGWFWTPYRKSLKVGSMNFIHDCGYSGKDAGARSRDVFGGNVCQGHNHAMAVSYAGTLKGKVHVGASVGWLGDPSKIDYMNQANVAKNWIHGVGVAYHDTGTGIVYLSEVPFINGTALVGGKVVRG